MRDLRTAPRKRLPKHLAVICIDECTGCGACVEVCPVDCIVRIAPSPSAPGMQSWYEIDWDRCIGCRLCIRIPTKKSEPHQLTICPWGAITMVPVEKLPQAVEHLGGPPQYAEENRSRFLEAAQRQVSMMRGG